MAARAVAGEVLTRSLADWAAYWDALGTLSAEQERWREHERQWRANLAAQGLLPAERLVADIRSGAKERRDQQNKQNLLDSEARLARLKREGYSFPPRVKTGVTLEMHGSPAWVVKAFRRAEFKQRRESASAKIHAPERREPVAAPATRPREQRRRSRTRPARGSPDDPHHLTVISLAAFRRELRRALGGTA